MFDDHLYVHVNLCFMKNVYLFIKFVWDFYGNQRNVLLYNCNNIGFVTVPVLMLYKWLKKLCAKNEKPVFNFANM